MLETLTLCASRHCVVLEEAPSSGANLHYACPSKRAPENVPDGTPDPPRTGSQKDPASRSQTRPKRSPRSHEKDPKEKPTVKLNAWPLARCALIEIRCIRRGTHLVRGMAQNGLALGSMGLGWALSSEIS